MFITMMMMGDLELSQSVTVPSLEVQEPQVARPGRVVLAGWAGPGFQHVSGIMACFQYGWDPSASSSTDSCRVRKTSRAGRTRIIALHTLNMYPRLEISHGSLRRRSAERFLQWGFP
eukprot:255985-Hanusia_phi.AAC.2